MSVKIERTYTCDRCKVETPFLNHGWIRITRTSMWSQDQGEEFDYCPACSKLAWAALKPDPAGVAQ